MALSTASIAGVVIAVLFTLSLLFALILFHNRRHRHVTKGLDDESPSMAPEGDASPSMSPPTLTGPKKRTHNNLQQHSRYPSLENGPGPILSRAGSKLLDRPATPGPNTPTPTVPSTAGSTATVLQHKGRPSTSGTNRPSSLHQAVLGNQEQAMKAEGEGTEAVGEKTKAEANVGRKMEGDAKPRGYTGAWP
jgi:hypothetical protein